MRIIDFLNGLGWIFVVSMMIIGIIILDGGQRIVCVIGLVLSLVMVYMIYIRNEVRK